MKKIFFSIIALTAVTVSSVSAQAFEGFSFGPKAGMNISNISDAKARVGLTAGGFVEYGFNDWLSVSADVLYSRQGFKYKEYNLGGTDYTVRKYTFDYLNVPVMANFYVWKGLALKTGLQPGLLLGAHNNDNKSVKNGLKSFDFSVPVGISYSFNFGLIIDARCNLGITKLGNGNYNGDNLSPAYNARHIVLSVTLGWRF